VILTQIHEDQNLFVPILYPLAQQFGIDGLHLGVVLVFNLCLGLITPPVGLTLSLAAKMADAPLHKAFVEALPFLFVFLVDDREPATCGLLSAERCLRFRRGAGGRR